MIDEIYFAKGGIEAKRHNYEKAIEFYENVYTKFAYDILADDAIFKAALILEENLSKPEKAAELYEKIIFDYGESVYAVEARKRYRMLSGNNDNYN